MNGSMGPREGRHADGDDEGLDVSRLPFQIRANSESCYVLTTND